VVVKQDVVTSMHETAPISDLTGVQNAVRKGAEIRGRELPSLCGAIPVLPGVPRAASPNGNELEHRFGGRSRCR
jgi:hypothetical protein